MNGKIKAFSLVELSIVLVILGLLTGGILAGQSLIHAAELRAVSTEHDRFLAAVQTFKDKYFGLPGDITNAATIWGAADGSTGSTAACATTSSSDSKTCNGNGDGIIAISTASDERGRFWQQLANAGLIEGSYNGVLGSGWTPGTNIPASKLDSGAGWNAYNNGQQSGSAINFDISFGNGIALYARPVQMGILTPAEAWNIDTKMDDGRPAYGRAVTPWSAAYSAAGVACTTAANSADMAATYNLADSNKDCGFNFRREF